MYPRTTGICFLIVSSCLCLYCNFNFFLPYPRTQCICSQLFHPPGEVNVVFALCPSLIEGLVAKKARIQPASVSFSDIQLPGPKAKRFVAGGPASWCQYLVNVYRQQVADPASQAALHHHQTAPDKKNTNTNANAAVSPPRHQTTDLHKSHSWDAWCSPWWSKDDLKGAAGGHSECIKAKPRRRPIRAGGNCGKE